MGEGTYGQVFLGVNLQDGATVALKKVSLRHTEEKHRHRGLPLNALREIRLLKNKCCHPNVVRLMDVAAYVPEHSMLPIAPATTEVVVGSDEKAAAKKEKWDEEHSQGFIYLVFEYVEHDLSGILDARYKFSLPAVKCLTKQLLDALAYLHEQNICHRDLKCSNILISKNHQLKLADFGLARELTYHGSMDGNTSGGGGAGPLFSNKVITLWYRPPELLLGDCQYGLSIDMWSVGCILYELLKNQVLFPGSDEMDQLKRIFSICGYPTYAEWPRHMELPGFKILSRLQSGSSSTGSAGGTPSSTSSPATVMPTNIEDYCMSKGLNVEACKLAARLLALDPSRRCTAVQALQASFFDDAVSPERLGPFESTSSLHEWETKTARKAKIQQEQMQLRVIGGGELMEKPGSVLPLASGGDGMQAVAAAATATAPVAVIVPVMAVVVPVVAVVSQAVPIVAAPAAVALPIVNADKRRKRSRSPARHGRRDRSASIERRGPSSRDHRRSKDRGGPKRPSRRSSRGRSGSPSRREKKRR